MDKKVTTMGLLFHSKMLCQCLLAFFNANHDAKYRCSDISDGKPSEEEKIDFVLLEVGSDDNSQAGEISLVKEKIADVKKRFEAKVIVIGSKKDEPLLKLCIMVGAFTFFFKEGGLDDLLQTIEWAEKGLCKREIIDDDALGRTLMPTISLFSLTRREKEVLALLIKELPNKQIGRKLHISLSTVKNHVVSIFKKLKIRGRHELIEQVGILVTDATSE